MTDYVNYTKQDREDDIERIVDFCDNQFDDNCIDVERPHDACPFHDKDLCRYCISDDLSDNVIHEMELTRRQYIIQHTKDLREVDESHKNEIFYNPDHYANDGNAWECGDAMITAFGEEAFLSFCLCNALKYIWRARSKGGNDDIRKAITYLEKYLEVEEQNSDTR